MKYEAIQTVFRHKHFLVYISARGMHLHREGPVTVEGDERRELPWKSRTCCWVIIAYGHGQLHDSSSLMPSDIQIFSKTHLLVD